VPANARYSLHCVAWMLGIPLERLLALADAPDRALYRPFEKKKAGKKPRPIDNPTQALKFVQRRIRTRILENLPLPSWMHGCVKNKGTFTNADVHKNQPSLGSVDVKKFFPAVTYRMVYQVFIRAGFGPEPARLLTRLTTRGGHLPQGAPTSDRLANLHLATASAGLESIFAAFELNNSAYVDDISFSGAKSREAIPRVISELRTIGLSVAHGKCGNAGATQPHRVTGFNTNSPKGPTLSKSARSKIRASVHRLITAGAHHPNYPKLERVVRSHFGRLRLTNAGEVSRLKRQLTKHGIDMDARRDRRGGSVSPSWVGSQTM
jgi:hypothetical protein